MSEPLDRNKTALPMTRRPILPEIRACVECVHGLYEGAAFSKPDGVGMRQTRHVVVARQQIVHLARDLGPWGWTELAAHFGLRSHAGIFEADRRSRERALIDPPYRQQLEEIAGMIAWICERSWRESPRDRAEAARAALGATLFARSPA